MQQSHWVKKAWEVEAPWGVSIHTPSFLTFDSIIAELGTSHEPPCHSRRAVNAHCAWFQHWATLTTAQYATLNHLPCRPPSSCCCCFSHVLLSYPWHRALQSLLSLGSSHSNWQAPPCSLIHDGGLAWCHHKMGASCSPLQTSKIKVTKCIPTASCEQSARNL